MGSIGNEKGTDGPGVLELAHGVRLDQHRRKRLEIASGSGLEPEFNALERSPKGGRFCFMGAVLPASELRRPRGYRRWKSTEWWSLARFVSATQITPISAVWAA